MRLLATLTTSAAIAAITSVAASAQQDWSQLSLTTGVDYSTGDYGASVDTDIFYVPLTAKYETSRFQFSATVPYLRIEGPGVVVGGGGGGVIVGGATPTVTTESGLGDVTLEGVLNLYPESDSGLPYAELSVKVKLPTADEERGLGTGEIDTTVAVDVFQSFGNFTPFAALGYRFRGDPDGFELEDGIVASVGAVVKASEQFSVGAAYDYREAATAFADPTSEVSPFVVFSPSEAWSANVYGVFGLSDGSPNAGGGVQLTRRF